MLHSKKIVINKNGVKSAFQSPFPIIIVKRKTIKQFGEHREMKMDSGPNLGLWQRK